MNPRTLKFRAWDDKNQKWAIYGFDILGECTIFDLVRQYKLEELCELKITQFTGCFDRNNKEIYEGDTVSFIKYNFDSQERGTGIIEYQDGYGSFDVCVYENNKLVAWHDLSFSEKNYTVIGNVFEKK